MENLTKIIIIAFLAYVLYNLCSKENKEKFEPSNYPFGQPNMNPILNPKAVAAPGAYVPQQMVNYQGSLEGFQDQNAQVAAQQNAAVAQIAAPQVAAQAAAGPVQSAQVANQQMAAAQQQLTARQVAQRAAQVAQPVEADITTVAADKLTAEDLLPKDTNALFAQLVPTTGSLEGVNLIEAGYHIGVNTIGQSLRNANYQIRSDPPIPKFNVGPFLNSTIDYDDNRRPFEIGSA
jgi:hypothetical protein